MNQSFCARQARERPNWSFQRLADTHTGHSEPPNAGRGIQVARPIESGGECKRGPIPSVEGLVWDNHAERWRVSKVTLANRRVSGEGPRYIKFWRRVMYPLSKVRSSRSRTGITLCTPKPRRGHLDFRFLFAMLDSPGGAHGCSSPHHSRESEVIEGIPPEPPSDHFGASDDRHDGAQ